MTDTVVEATILNTFKVLKYNVLDVGTAVALFSARLWAGRILGPLSTWVR
jgi:hypothetical protein